MNLIDISIIIAALFGFYFGSQQGFDNKLTKGTLASLVFLITLYVLPPLEDMIQIVTGMGMASLLGTLTYLGMQYYKAGREVRQGLKVCMVNNNLGGITVALFFGIFSLFLWDTAIVNEIVSTDMDGKSIFIAILDNKDNPIDFSGVKLVASERP